MKRYISDLHIGHENCLGFDQRPFFTLDEMHQAIIDNWNSAVGNNDDIYILGDYTWHCPTGIEVIRQLKGNKFLINGNHDRVSSELAKEFVWMKDYDIVKDGNNHVVLCHYPIAHWRNADYGYVHLYGHVHKGRDSRPFEEYIELMHSRNIPYRCYNVGCMMPYIGYTPRTLSEIEEGYNTYKEQIKLYSETFKGDGNND